MNVRTVKVLIRSARGEKKAYFKAFTQHSFFFFLSMEGLDHLRIVDLL